MNFRKRLGRQVHLESGAKSLSSFANGALESSIRESMQSVQSNLSRSNQGRLADMSSQWFRMYAEGD